MYPSTQHVFVFGSRADALLTGGQPLQFGCTIPSPPPPAKKSCRPPTPGTGEAACSPRLLSSPLLPSLVCKGQKKKSLMLGQWERDQDERQAFTPVIFSLQSLTLSGLGPYVF